MATLHTWTLLIDGVDISNYIQKKSIKFSMTRGGREVLSFATVDKRTDGSAFRPLMDEVIELFIDGTRVFYGWITSLGESPISGIRGGTRCACRATGRSLTLSRVFVTREYGTTLVPILISMISNPAIVQTHVPHNFVTGNKVRILGHSGGTLGDGDYTVTVTGADTFTVPVNNIAASGSGTVRRLYTLKEIITDIVTLDAGPAFGITLTMPANGPYMEPQSFNDAAFEDILGDATTSTGYVSRLTPSNVLLVGTPGDANFSSLFALTSAVVNSPVTTDATRESYVNRVILYFGPNEQRPGSQILGDGVSRVFPLDYPRAAATELSLYELPAVGYRNVGVWGVETLFEWTWRASDNSIVQLAVAPPGVPNAIRSPGSILVNYVKQYPTFVVAQDLVDIGIKGPWPRKFTRADLYDKAAAQEAANGLLVRGKQTQRKYRSGTTAGLAWPGSTITATSTYRQVSGTWTIESVGFALMGRGIFYYDYELTEGVIPGPTWLDDARTLTGGSRSGNPSTVVAVVSPPPPPTAAGAGSYFLGAMGIIGVRSAAPTWIPACGGVAEDSPLQIKIDTTVRGNTSATITCRLKIGPGAVSVRARLFDVTNHVACAGMSGIVATANWSTQVFPVTLSTGLALYELQLLPGAANKDVFGVGSLE